MSIGIGSAARMRVANWLPQERLTLYLVGVLLIYAAMLVIPYIRHWWFIDAAGHPMTADFIFLWAGGHLAMSGEAATVYDWTALKQIEIDVLGHPFAGYFAWLHPPMLLMVAELFALVPYMLSWFLWDALTVLFFVWAISRIHNHPSSLLIGLAAPASLWCAMLGQDGFVTAGLMAGTLAYLETNPVLAGIFLGLLTYKPHFGLLFPLVLLATRHWRALASATATALAFAVASFLVLGVDTWQKFFGSLAKTTDFLLVGGPKWTMLQSVYALTHELTGSDAIAWIAHISMVLGIASIVIWAWRRPISYNVKAALLGAATILAPPYVFAYDSVALMVPAAFLIKDGRQRGFLPGDKIAIFFSLVPVIAWLLLDTSAATPLACALLFVTALRRASIEEAPSSLTPVISSL
jgi:hypothetical protein